MAKVVDPISRFKEDRLRMFWSFVVERQQTYWRRQSGQPQPWSKDPFIQELFFCNVYRELDRGTQFAMREILDKTKDPAILIYRILMYRMFNNPRTYLLMKDGHSGIQRPSDALRIADKLDSSRESGNAVFKNAWMTSGANIVNMSKARAYCIELHRVWKDIKQLTNRVLAAKTMEDAWMEIRSVRWFGAFSAYQVVLDLSYHRLFEARWSDRDTWVYPGPGAKLGLFWLCGGKPVKRSGSGVSKEFTYEDCEKMIHHLCKNQDKYFKQFGLKFRRWEGKRLDAHNLEFSLCETNKYFRAQYGGKKKKFVPTVGA